MRVPSPEAPMNEGIDRIPRQPGIKLSPPPPVFCDPQGFAVLLFKVLTVGISPRRQREAVVCAAILKTQNQHPPSFQWATFSFPTVKNQATEQDTQGLLRGEGENLSEAFFSSSPLLLFAAQLVGISVGFGAKGSPKRKRWVLMVFLC